MMRFKKKAISSMHKPMVALVAVFTLVVVGCGGLEDRAFDDGNASLSGQEGKPGGVEGKLGDKDGKSYDKDGKSYGKEKKPGELGKKKADPLVDCFYGCVKKGLDKDDCKKMCVKIVKVKKLAEMKKKLAAMKKKAGAEKYQKSEKQVKAGAPGCKAFQKDTQLCKFCWDARGQVVSKACL